MGLIDAHAHIWTPDTAHYPLAEGYKKEDMKPASFTAQELLKHAKAVGVDRVNLIQMSFYGFDNSYMLDMIKLHDGVFAGTAVIDPHAADPARKMEELAKLKVRAFRIHPRLSQQPADKWLRPEGYAKMFAAAAKNKQALSCLIDPDGLPEVERMCSDYKETTVIIDHLARIGVDGTIRDKDIDSVCALAKHKKVLVKVGAFYALGKKKPPYDDLGPLIKRVVKAFGPDRCMWESDSPFQVQGEHTYEVSIELVRKRLDFLTADDREWLLRKTAEKVFFAKK
jgi:predicted TIM-barrel fold metal-dependent hydrolase